MSEEPDITQGILGDSPQCGVAKETLQTGDYSIADNSVNPSEMTHARHHQ